jgi:hypothetical protein
MAENKSGIYIIKTKDGQPRKAMDLAAINHFIDSRLHLFNPLTIPMDKLPNLQVRDFCGDVSREILNELNVFVKMELGIIKAKPKEDSVIEDSSEDELSEDDTPEPQQPAQKQQQPPQRQQQQPQRQPQKDIMQDDVLDDDVVVLE